MADRHADLNDVPGAADLDDVPEAAGLADVLGAADLTAPFAHLCPRPYALVELVSQGALEDERLALLDEARSDVPGGARLALLNQARRSLERFLVEQEVVVVVELYQALEGELSISWCPVEKAAPVPL